MRLTTISTSERRAGPSLPAHSEGVTASAQPSDLSHSSSRTCSGRPSAECFHAITCCNVGDEMLRLGGCHAAVLLSLYAAVPFRKTQDNNAL
ncbi:hypothetical protein HBI56_039630 [Parastagonospora nodorum]|uniref:Uncharacterized protein n=1 Tax=Phaeosphaeria nodorum (strain SN15 / ATCC MYA-4574 / FGSC 10173) TaxID=321614 RepID=A0A7U2EUL7_PHANO|nr:hypothetical protein HBH56_067160 [Parastagonospora nodorum]QRC93401.1 hypothetical protein JI435_403760 [Parastagonospora nodorum SN15]KAH3932669.1 hypothetical protein HBH54_080950 [Parastagonospora nodorum]KAH3954726.1 hypothetical protein HBH53_013450 [Parastagonospora nodorum]KAH3986361.1 hypothetical protein HBH52_044640 [Parastagonospora nodorum]